MRNKKLIIIFAVIILIIGAALFLGKQESPSVIQQASQNEISTVPTSNYGNKIEAVEGTIKGLITRGRTEKCTFSYNTDYSTITGQVYLANGKIREEFQSTSIAGPINGNMILDSMDGYIWTDQMSQGIKFPFGKQPTPSVKNKSTPDINKTMHFDCLPWEADNSKFAIPDNITFQNM